MEKDGDRKIISFEYRSEQFLQATMENLVHAKDGMTLLGVLSELQEKLEKGESGNEHEWMSAAALLNEKAEEAGFLAKGVFDLLCPTMISLDLNPGKRGRSVLDVLLSWLKRGVHGNLDAFERDSGNLRDPSSNLTALLFLSAHLAAEKVISDMPGSESAITDILATRGLNTEEPEWPETPTGIKDCRGLLDSLDSALTLFRSAAWNVPNVGHSFDYD